MHPSAIMNSVGPPLSALVTDAVKFFFEEESRVVVAAVLFNQCGFGLPLASSPELIERIRLGVLRLGHGNVDHLLGHLAEAQQDWRDVLVAAGFGDDITAHTKWATALSTWSFDIKEVSACVYEVVATDSVGRSARFKGTAPDLLLAEARSAALQLMNATSEKQAKAHPRTSGSKPIR